MKFNIISKRSYTLVRLVSSHDARVVQSIQIDKHAINIKRTIGIDAEKSFDKIQYPFMIKSKDKLCMKGSDINIMKVTCQMHSQYHTEC